MRRIKLTTLRTNIMIIIMWRFQELKEFEKESEGQDARLLS